MTTNTMSPSRSRSAAARSLPPATARGRAKPAPAKPALRLINAAIMRRERRQRRLVLLVATIFALVMFVVATAQAQLVQGQRELDAQRAAVSAAKSEKLRLERQIVVASAPQVIVERATAMGMVRAQDPQYLIAVRSIGEP